MPKLNLILKLVFKSTISKMWDNDTTHIIKIQDSAKGIRLSVLATCSQTRQKPKKEEIPISTNEND